MGKGDGRRPPAISDAELKANWDRVFRQLPLVVTDAAGDSINLNGAGVDTPAQGPQITDT